MSNDDQHSQKEPKLKLALGAPNTTVPSHVRSSRLLPRAISIAAIFVWIIVFYAGTSALAKREKQLSLGEQSLINTGITYLGMFSGDDPQCIGYLKTDVNDEKNIVVNSDGSFRLKLGALSYTVEMKALVKFNDYNGLAEFEFEALIADGRIRAIKTQDKEPNLVVVVSIAGKRQQQEVPFPHPIFLVEKSPSTYAVSLPTNTNKQIRSFSQQQNALGAALGIKTRVLDATQAGQCQTHLNNASSAKSIQAIEIGKYLRLMNFKITENLTGTNNGLSSNQN
jgi:hypothetical protein